MKLETGKLSFAVIVGRVGQLGQSFNGTAVVRENVMGLNGQKILITGGAGYLATNLIAQLRETDCHIIRVDLPGAMFAPVTGKAYVDDIEGNISDRAVWMSNLENVDVVFHLAAYEHKHGSEFNPILDFEVNSLSVLHLLEVCRLKKYVPRIVFASSSNLVGFPNIADRKNMY